MTLAPESGLGTCRPLRPSLLTVPGFMEITLQQFTGASSFSQTDAQCSTVWLDHGPFISPARGGLGCFQPSANTVNHCRGSAPTWAATCRGGAAGGFPPERSSPEAATVGRPSPGR